MSSETIGSPTSKFEFEKIMSHFKLNEKNSGTWIGSRSFSGSGEYFSTNSPIDGAVLAEVENSSETNLNQVIDSSVAAFQAWRIIPSPKRGELIRLFGERLRVEKKLLAKLITLEVGKIPSEAEGEIQEMIDMCDLAVGQSRELYGRTIASERMQHRLMEQWQPLGPVAVISAFNFPVAVWCWNSALALVCGDPVIWKPSEKAPLCALAVYQILAELVDGFPEAPEGLISLVNGGKEVGEQLSASHRVPLVCATGSVHTGRAVAQTVSSRLGRSLLELGGNNAMIVCKSADLKLAERAITFAAVGTAGQRCTSLRRLIVHDSIAKSLSDRLSKIYESLKIGSPLEENVLVGPLIDEGALKSYERALERAKQDGGTLRHGGRFKDKSCPEGGFYVKPALIEISKDSLVHREETFAPILYILAYKTLEEAIEIHNDVPQGLSSAIFTTDIREAELFLSPAGSDCGIANVNIGTSGAEIGGAFGGEKETGGGRQAGSDSWKSYMRRSTNTINYSLGLPHAQGVQFV